MKRMTLRMIGIAALGFSCSQAPPPKVAPTTHGSQSPKDSGEATPDVPPEDEFSQRETEEPILTLTALVTELQVDMYGKKALYDALKGATPRGLPITPELQNLLKVDPFISQLETRLQAAEEDLKAAQGRFGPNHRVTKLAQTTRDAAADRVKEERARKVVEYQRDQLEQARRNFLEVQEQLVTLKDQLLEAQIEQKSRDAIRQRREADAKEMPPPTTQRTERWTKRLAQLRDEEKKLTTQFQASTKKYEELERTKGTGRLAIDAAFNEWLQIGGQLSALREKIAGVKGQLPAQNAPSTDAGASEITQRETEEKILTLTALVTELQVDFYGKKAFYEALKSDPNSTRQSLRSARKNIRECVEQLWTLKASLAEAKEEQREHDRRHTERLQREQQAKETQTPR